MLDNLLILCIAGAVVCAVFAVLGFIAEYFDWR
jgi:hypothetical protein